MSSDALAKAYIDIYARDHTGGVVDETIRKMEELKTKAQALASAIRDEGAARREVDALQSRIHAQYGDRTQNAFRQMARDRQSVLDAMATPERMGLDEGDALLRMIEQRVLALRKEINAELELDQLRRDTRGLSAVADMTRRADQITNKNRTKEEIAAEEEAELNQLLTLGHIQPRAYQREMDARRLSRQRELDAEQDRIRQEQAARQRELDAQDEHRDAVVSRMQGRYGDPDANRFRELDRDRQAIESLIGYGPGTITQSAGDEMLRMIQMRAQALREEIQAERELNDIRQQSRGLSAVADMTRRADQITNQYRTGLERLAEEEAELNQLRQLGHIQPRTHQRGMESIEARRAELTTPPRDIEAERDANLLRAQSVNLIRDISTAQDQYNNKIALYERMLRAGLITEQQHAVAVRQAQDAMRSQTSLVRGDFAFQASYAIQDVATIASMQGMRLSDYFRAASNNVSQMMFAIKGLSPAMIGLAGAGAAVASALIPILWEAWTDSAGKAERANKELEESLRRLEVALKDVRSESERGFANTKAMTDARTGKLNPAEASSQSDRLRSDLQTELRIADEANRRGRMAIVERQQRGFDFREALISGGMPVFGEQKRPDTLFERYAPFLLGGIGFATAGVSKNVNTDAILGRVLAREMDALGLDSSRPEVVKKFIEDEKRRFPEKENVEALDRILQAHASGVLALTGADEALKDATTKEAEARKKAAVAAKELAEAQQREKESGWALIRSIEERIRAQERVAEFEMERDARERKEQGRTDVLEREGSQRRQYYISGRMSSDSIEDSLSRIKEFQDALQRRQGGGARMEADMDAYLVRERGILGREISDLKERMNPPARFGGFADFGRDFQLALLKSGDKEQQRFRELMKLLQDYDGYLKGILNKPDSAFSKFN